MPPSMPECSRSPPTYLPGDRVEFYGEVLEIARYHRGDGLTGYWLAHEEEEIFVPIESEYWLLSDMRPDPSTDVYLSLDGVV